MNFKQKKGISLIVLVITIIVMIILASAVILSLSGAGIIGKANEAKTASDNANKKQAAAVLYSEWLLANSQGETDKTAREYIKDGLVDMGLESSDVAVTDDGEILTGLTQVAVTFVEENVAVGTVVTGYELPTASTVSTTPGQEYTISLLTSTASAATYTVPAKATAGTAKGVTYEGVAKTVKAIPNLIWRYMGIDDKGNALITPDIPCTDASGNIDSTSTLVENRNTSDYTIGLGYEGGFLYGEQILNEACDTLYTTEKGKARSWNYDDVFRVLNYSGPKYGYGKNVNNASSYTPTNTALTIAELVELNGLQSTAVSTYTPNPNDNNDWNAIKNYKSNYFKATILDFEDSVGRDIVFGDTDRNGDGVIADTEGGHANYWLATTAITFNAFAKDVAYYMPTVGSEGQDIGAVTLRTSGMTTNSSSGSCNYRAIRPVVELAGTLEIEIGTTVELLEVE